MHITTHNYYLGFYDSCDQIINWMNSTDTSKMTTHEFLSILNTKLLEMRPKINTSVNEGIIFEDNVEISK